MTKKAAVKSGRVVDENCYPPESAIKPEIIRPVKKAEADIAAGKGKTYTSMDDFIRDIKS